MYTPLYASKVKQQFWTRFGQYMAPVPSADGKKINWINYKTGIRNLSFKMDATKEAATIHIEIAHKDLDFALTLYDQFLHLKTLLEADLQERWEWNKFVENEHGQIISRIGMAQKDHNVLDENDWPGIISFLKPRIIRLDKFWCNHQMIFEMLV